MNFLEAKAVLTVVDAIVATAEDGLLSSPLADQTVIEAVVGLASVARHALGDDEADYPASIRRALEGAWGMDECVIRLDESEMDILKAGIVEVEYDRWAVTLREIIMPIRTAILIDTTGRAG